MKHTPTPTGVVIIQDASGNFVSNEHNGRFKMSPEYPDALIFTIREAKRLVTKYSATTILAGLKIVENYGLDNQQVRS